MTRRPAAPVTMLAAAAAVLIGAAGLAQSAGRGNAQARTGGTLRLASFEDVGPVDTALGYGGTTWAISFATCAKLFNHPDAEGATGTRIAPEVVRTWAVSRDRRVYDFELRRTFRFHTGAPVTAQSFADAFDRNADPRLRALYATPSMREIEGAQAVIDGTARSISGVRVLGRYRLQIRLTKPLGDFTGRLTLPFFCPVLPDTARDAAGINDPAGSGPYYVAEYVPNHRLILKRNPFYRGARPARVDQVVWTSGLPREDCIRETEENRIDQCFPPGFSPATALRPLVDRYGINRPGGQFFRGQGLTTWYLAFNHDRPAFKGPGQIALKRAINYAVDRPDLVRTVGHLAGQRTDQMLPPSLGRAADIYPLGGPNLVAARRLYDQAAYKPTRLVFYTASGPGPVAQSHVLKFNLKQLGIDLEVKYFDTATLVEKAETRGEPFDLIRNGWGADYADGGAFLVPVIDGRRFQATSNLNVAYFNDPWTNARIDAASRLTGEARREAWADLDIELMRKNPPWVPLYNASNRSFVSKSFGCFVFHPLYGVDIAAACKK